MIFNILIFLNKLSKILIFNNFYLSFFIGLLISYFNLKDRNKSEKIIEESFHEYHLIIKGLCYHDIIKCRNCIKNSSVCFQDLNDCAGCMKDLIYGHDGLFMKCQSKGFISNFGSFSNDLCHIEYKFHNL